MVFFHTLVFKDSPVENRTVPHITTIERVHVTLVPRITQAGHYWFPSLFMKAIGMSEKDRQPACAGSSSVLLAGVGNEFVGFTGQRKLFCGSRNGVTNHVESRME